METAVNIKGPLGFGLSAFLMGQSSTALEGILVLPGLIDADYCGTVKIMIHVLIPPVSIPKGTRIAQLVPFRSCVPNPGEVQRGNGGFGSTGKPQVYFAMDTTRGKPEKVVQLEGPDGVVIKKPMTINTGADVTIISRCIWPPSWPSINPNFGIAGIGGTQATLVSQLPITFVFPDGEHITTCPYFMTTPTELFGLVGRDLLSQMKAMLVTHPF